MPPFSSVDNTNSSSVAPTLSSPAATPPQKSTGLGPHDPNAGRSSFARQLGNAAKTIIPRNKVISDATRDENLSRAQTRLQEMFAEKSPDQYEADHATSSAMVHAYLQDYKQRKNMSVDPPKDVADLMIEFDMATRDVATAIEFGPGNILKRKNEQGKEIVDQDKTFGKERLMLLAEDIYPEIAAKRNERPLQFSTKITALGLLSGAGSCANYTHALALLAAYRLGPSAAFQAKVSFEICSGPYRQGQRVDHVYGIVNYRATDGRNYQIILDPSAHRHHVIFADDSQLENPRSRERINYFDKVDSTTVELIGAHMKVSSDSYLQAVHRSPGHAAKVQRAEQPLLDNYVPEQHYDLNNTLAGRTDAPLDNAKPKVAQTESRRMSFSDPSASPLLRDD